MTRAEKLTTIAESEKQVYFSGRQDASEEFWDSITNYGKRTNYQSAFTDWGGEHFHPTRKIVPISQYSSNQFMGWCTRLKRVERAYLDFSQKTRGTSNTGGYYYTFYQCPELEVVEDIGMQADYCYNVTFGSCPKLRKVSKIRCDEDTKFSQVFDYCYALENVYFEGIIGQNGLNFRWSTKLSKGSIESIINALSGDTSGLTLTFSEAAVNKAFETAVGENNGSTSLDWEYLIGSHGNWNIVLA